MKEKQTSHVTGALACMGVLVACLILAPIVVPIFVPWSAINCRQQEINVKTGRARHSRYLWFLKASETVRDTPLSVALDGEVVYAAPIKPWHRVNTFSPGISNSPHYVFHGAFSQAREMEMICEMIDATPAQKRDIAREILTLWQQAGGDWGCDDYLLELGRQAGEKTRETGK